MTDQTHFRRIIRQYDSLYFRADIAQLVEQRIRNAKVVGSTPIIGTSHFYLVDLVRIKSIQSEIA